MNRLERIIEELKLYEERSEGLAVVKTTEVLESLKEYELNDSAAALIEDFIESEELSYEDAFNSYNLNARLSHDIQLKHYIINAEDYIELKLHLSGDIRSNYSESAFLKGIDLQHVLYAVNEYNFFHAFTLKGEELFIDASALSESAEVYDKHGEVVLYSYESSIEDIIEDVLNNYLNIKKGFFSYEEERLNQ
jgi:hypothetical protein